MTFQIGFKIVPEFIAGDFKDYSFFRVFVEESGGLCDYVVKRHITRQSSMLQFHIIGYAQIEISHAKLKLLANIHILALRISGYIVFQCIRTCVVSTHH